MTAWPSKSAAPARAPVPFSIVWQDPAHHFAIEFQVRAIRAFEEVIASARQNTVGVLLGSQIPDPNSEHTVVDVAAVASGDSAQLPLSPAVLAQIRYWNSSARMSAVGLWILARSGATAPQPSDFASLDGYFDTPLPIVVVTTAGTPMPDARVYLWLPAERKLQPAV